MRALMARMILLCWLPVLAGCASGGGETDTSPIVAAWTADVEAMGAQGHSGFATVTVLPDGVTRANLTLRGGSAGGHHPWRIREGLCPSGDSEPAPVGAEIGPAEAYPPLEPNEQGNASATAVLNLQLDPDAEYHLDVSQSPDDPEVVGCGNLTVG
jgi:hypothetical protein